MKAVKCCKCFKNTRKFVCRCGHRVCTSCKEQGPKFRFIVIKMDCGHRYYQNTGRYRVSKDLAAILFGNLKRSGAWCSTCVGRCMPVKIEDMVSR